MAFQDVTKAKSLLFNCGTKQAKKKLHKLACIWDCKVF